MEALPASALIEAPVIQADVLHNFVSTVFARAGVPPEQAVDAADVLLYASRRGVDTHGIRNLKPIYIDGFTAGHLKPHADYKIEYETPLTARVDGGKGLGLTAACWAMRLAMQKAQQSGIGMVVMRNSYHFGAAGYYPWMALQQDMIGIGMTARVYAREHYYGVLPTFGAKSMFSTNPLSISFPTKEEPPWLLDMSTSTVPFNRIMMMRDAGQQIPLGWGGGCRRPARPIRTRCAFSRRWVAPGNRAATKVTALPRWYRCCAIYWPVVGTIYTGMIRGRLTGTKSMVTAISLLRCGLTFSGDWTNSSAAWTP